MTTLLSELFTDSNGTNLVTHDPQWAVTLRAAQTTPGTAKIQSNQLELIQNTNAGGTFCRRAMQSKPAHVRMRHTFTTAGSLNSDETLAYSARVSGVIDVSDYHIDFEIAPVSGGGFVISTTTNATYNGAAVAAFVGFAFATSKTYNVLIECFDQTPGTAMCRMKVWDASGAEPNAWNISGTATTVTAGGDVAVQVFTNTGAPCTQDIDSFVVENVGPAVAVATQDHGTSMGVSHSVSLTGLGTITAGDLLIAVAISDTPSTTDVTAAGNWVRLDATVEGVNVDRSALFALIAAGSDTLTMSGAAQDFVVAVWRIPVGTHAVRNVSDPAQLGFAVAKAATGSIDPPSLTMQGPTGDILWIAAGMLDLTTGNTLTGDPTGFTNDVNQVSASSTSSVGMRASHCNESGVTTKDPSTIAASISTRDWIAYTVGVRGWAGALPFMPPRSRPALMRR